MPKILPVEYKSPYPVLHVKTSKTASAKHKSPYLSNIHEAITPTATARKLATNDPAMNCSEAIRRIENRLTSQVLKPTTIPKSASRKQARLSKKRVYDQYDVEHEKPHFNAYSQCVCDLHGYNEGRDELSDAKAMGRTTEIVHGDGRTSAHLWDCVEYPVQFPLEYDSETIASDILRALGAHPYLEPLNEHLRRQGGGENASR